MTSSINTTGGEGRLGFVTIAQKTFAFLEQMGFTVVSRESTFIRYESERVFVNIYHGRSSYQIGLELGQKRLDELYSLYEILSVAAPSKIDQARYQTTHPSVLERCLENIAETVEHHCQMLLEGDETEFKRLYSLSEPRRKAYTLQAQYGAIIDGADQAWEQKNYSEAAELYQRAVPALDEMRRRRLEYLRRVDKRDKK